MGTPRTGNKIGNYLICEQIGGGAMGRVWRGIDEALGRPVAIKMLRTELAEHPKLIERFRVEARALARLSHPNIAGVFALVEEDGDLYLVMEHVEGETLHARLERHGALPMNEAFPLLHQALDGIQHAHDAGVVHRDIKASNLMLGPNGQAKWIDFGIARLDGVRGSTRTGGLMGTPEYMAPEQVRGESGTIQSDIYSLGVLLYKLVTGRSPFAGQAEFEVMRAHVETPPPRPSELGIDVGEELEDVLMRALEKDPAQRFQSARAFQDALVEAGAPKPHRVTLPPVPESDATLCDANPPPPAPTRGLDDSLGGEISATVPGLHPGALRPGFDPEAPTRVDLEPEGRPRRLALWIGAGLLAVGAALALNWIVTSSGPEPDHAPALEQAAPAGPASADGANASEPRAEEAGAEGVRPEEATPEAAGGSAPAPRHKPAGKPKAGWEIVR